jgi:hypothetical protein
MTEQEINELKDIRNRLDRLITNAVGDTHPEPAPDAQGRPYDPTAKTTADLVSPKQLGYIRSLAKDAGVDADVECGFVMNCGTQDLSKKAASSFIDHLKELAKKKGKAA